MSPSSPSPLLTAKKWRELDLLQTIQESAGNSAIVTSTERAARTLRQRYNQQQSAAGRAGWRGPEILTWKSWMMVLWNAAILHGIEERLPLTEIQELGLWQNILASDEMAQKTIAPGALATAAQKTWAQMQRYKIPLSRLRRDDTLDTGSFYRWVVMFEKLCRKSSFLSSPQLEEAVAQWILSPAISLPKEIFLLGFDRVVPSQRALIDSLQKRDIAVRFVELAPPGTFATEHTIVCSPTIEDEIVSAAYWTRARLFRDPTQKIGILVPSLESARSSIDTIFRRILAPSTMDTRLGDSKLPYEFSLGTPMRQMRPVQTALILLRWLNHALSAEEASWLLVHGCFNEHFDMSRDMRSALDKKFRERKFQLGTPVSFSTFRTWLSQTENAEGLTSFRKTIDQLFLTAKRAAMGKSRSFIEWREFIEELLTTAHWHLLTPKTSADYQLLQRWNFVLDSLSSLNSISEAVSFSTALDKLEQLASHTLFTLQTSNAPALIVGVSESAGLVFDAVWWMGAQTGKWPSQGKVLPFLPWMLQHDAHMPYADTKEDYAFALRTTERILECADVVNVSFSLQEGTATDSSSYVPAPEIVLTPLVRQIWPETPIKAAEILSEEFQDSEDKSVECDRLESIYEETAVPFQGATVRGGVRFLELQAACPFRAFAELRLGARALEESPNGISTRDQGSIIHTVLDQFWKQVQTQKALLTMALPELSTNLRGYIDAALKEFSAAAEEPWQKHLISIEADRLVHRLTEWLEVEKHRPEFTVVSTETELKNSELGGVHFHCRVDRMDRVQQGIALLDYKTGKVDRKSCEGNRPDQPQLTAYAVLHKQSAGAEGPLAGIAFAGLHPQKVDLTVIRSLPSVFNKDEKSPVEGGEPRKTLRIHSSKLTPDQMRDLENIWDETLTRLAEAFQAGLAIVDPKNHAKTCKHCEQTLLCRIRETDALQDEAEESAIEVSGTGEDQ